MSDHFPCENLVARNNTLLMFLSLDRLLCYVFFFFFLLKDENKKIKFTWDIIAIIISSESAFIILNRLSNLWLLTNVYITQLCDRWWLFSNLQYVFIERYSLAVSEKLLNQTFWIRLNLFRGQTLLFHHIWNKQRFGGALKSLYVCLH